jgi:hypothetical protein
MNTHTIGKEKVIYYDCITRCYAIRISKRVVQSIRFCPWCGIKLPTDLTNELSTILLDQLKLDDIFDDPRMPAEFKTDEWWKKRNL